MPQAETVVFEAEHVINEFRTDRSALTLISPQQQEFLRSQHGSEINQLTSDWSQLQSDHSGATVGHIVSNKNITENTRRI